MYMRMPKQHFVNDFLLTAETITIMKSLYCAHSLNLELIRVIYDSINGSSWICSFIQVLFFLDALRYGLTFNKRC